MAKKETLEQFIRNFGKFDNLIQSKTMGKWNRNTLLTMVDAQKFSIVKSGNLQGSARRVNAIVTADGIKSAFIFGVPYAYRIETGKDQFGHLLTQRSFVNPMGGFGYAKKAVDKNEHLFMNDLDKIISEAFNRV